MTNDDLSQSSSVSPVDSCISHMGLDTCVLCRSSQMKLNGICGTGFACATIHRAAQTNRPYNTTKDTFWAKEKRNSPKIAVMNVYSQK